MAPYRMRTAATVIAIAVLAPLTGCAASGGASVTLALVAYSTPQLAYQQVIKAFRATPAGRGVRFTESYGSSGDQSRAVAAGLAADVVAFSLEPDLTRLVKAGIVAPDWRAGPGAGMVTDSVVVIATRRGNPRGLRDWPDLIRPGVQVIEPNPFTSGGARWNVLAAYGAASTKDSDRPAGVAYLQALFRNVPVQDDSARKATQTFVAGKGDALLCYENEAIFARQHGQALDYTVPAATILIENPVAVTTTSKHPVQARDFLAFLHSGTAQQIFARNGYRPTATGIAGFDRFPEPAQLFTVADLGGWTTVSRDFFDPGTGIVADIERSLGVSVTNARPAGSGS
jgi:sulfate/thiosulfate transport system substrate-binding protein